MFRLLHYSILVVHGISEFESVYASRIQILTLESLDHRVRSIPPEERVLSQSRIPLLSNLNLNIFLVKKMLCYEKKNLVIGTFNFKFATNPFSM